MQIYRQIAVALCILVCSFGFAKDSKSKAKGTASTSNAKTSTFDSSQLVRKSETVQIQSSSSEAKKKKLSIDLTNKEDPKKLEVQIKALNLIIKSEKDRDKKIGLYLRKSYLHVSAAKMLGMSRSKTNTITAREKYHLDESRKILNFLLKSINNDKRTLSTIYNILGLVEYESDRHDKTVENFIKSIEYDAKNSQAEVMSMFIAEYYFDHDQFQKSIDFYNKLYNQMSPYQKALADYKTAWANINLKDFSKAESLFVKVINNNYDKPITEDSYKDLAFIITQKNDEFYSIEKSKQLFNDKSLRAKFLYYNLLFFLQQSKNNPREALFKEIFAIQEDNYERTKIYILKVAFEKRDYPSSQVYYAVLNVNKHLSSMPIEAAQKFVAVDAKQFEEDNEIIIRQFVDAYSGRLKLQEHLAKLQISKMLIDLIAVQLKWFPQSQHFLVFYNLWIDTCVDTKNSKCLLDLEKDLQGRLSERAEMKMALRRIQLEILSLYDDAAQKDPATHEKAFYFRLKEYEASYPNDPQQLKIDKKILSIDFKNKNFQESMVRAEKIYKLEKNAQNLEKLFLTLFELSKYKEIATHPDVDLYKTKEINDIRREVSLKLAQDSSKNGQFEDYQKNVKVYMSTSPSLDKMVIVQCDYLNQLLTLQKYDLFVKEWQSMPPELVQRKEINSVLANAHAQVLNNGYYTGIDALKIYRGDQELKFQTLLYRMSLKDKWTNEDKAVFDSLSEPRQAYVYNLMAVTDASNTLSLLGKKKHLSEVEKKVLKLSLILSKRDDHFMLSEAEMKTYKDYVTADHWFDKEAPIEKVVRNIDFPKPEMKPAQYNNLVEVRVKDVKLIRQKAIKKLPDLTKTQKTRVLKGLLQNENNMAAAILAAPAPNGLTPEQLQEYKAGLEELSKEYSNQALEFQKALHEIEGQDLKDDEASKAEQLQEIKTSQWSMPSVDQSDKAVKIFEKVSPVAALIYIDHELEAKKLTVENYLTIRAGLFLRIENTPAMRRLIRDEFMAQQQQGLIEKWKKLK